MIASGSIQSWEQHISILRISLLLASISRACTTHAQIFQAYAEATVTHVADAESGAAAYLGPYGIAGASTNYSSYITGGFFLGASVNAFPESAVSLGVGILANIAPADPGYFFFTGVVTRF